MYPGIKKTIKNQIPYYEFEFIEKDLSQVETLAWDTTAACKVLEEAAKKSVDAGFFMAAEKILHYYVRFYISALTD